MAQHEDVEIEIGESPEGCWACGRDWAARPFGLTSAEVARYVGCTRSLVILAVKQHRLQPAGKLPGPLGAYLFDIKDVMAWREQVGNSSRGLGRRAVR